MGRFEDVTEDVGELLHDVMQEYFPEFRNVRIKGLFDMKKRMSGGKIVLARIQKTNDLLRHLTVEESRSDDGYDVILYIDGKCWENIDREDRVRILRHELQHIELKETGTISIRDHEITDFYEEIERNVDDPRWRERVSTLTMDIYDQEADQTENARQRRGGRRR